MSIYFLNPFSFTVPTTKVRTYYNNGYGGPVTTINTTQQTHRTISTTEVSGNEWVFFWQAILDHDGTNADAIGILNESPTERQRFNLESQDATDQHSVGGAYAYAGGTDRTITLDSIEESAATNEIENYALSALELADSEEWGHSSGQSDSVTSTYATKTSITVGPGTWIIVASASLLQSAAGVTKVRVFDGTSTYNEQSGTVYAQDTTNWVPYWAVRRITTTVASTTFSLQWARVAATGTASIRQATIVALDQNEFENVYYAEQITEQTTTSTTDFGGTGLSSTFNFVNPTNNHLILGCAWTASSATTRSTRARLFNATTLTDYSGEHLREANATTERYPTVVAQINSFTENSETIEWEHSIAQGAGTSTIGNMAIAILDLGAAPTELVYRLWLWGNSGSGLLGTNTQTNNLSSPVQTVSGGTDWKSIGFRGTIKTDGTLWMWGGNRIGELGTNDQISRSSPTQIFGGGTNWKQIAPSEPNGFDAHTAAVKTDGTLWSWGENRYGQLGDGTSGNTVRDANAKSSPVQVFGGGTNWSFVSVGDYYTGALKTDGTLWLWGRNLYGQLGNNDASILYVSSPVQTVSGGTNWKKLSCGFRHVAAIKTDGTLWSWGEGGSGELGDNSAILKSSPVQVFGGGTNWHQVSAGSSVTAAIKTDGTLWLWGNNLNGQLGDNTSGAATYKSSPVQTVSGGNNWKLVSAGSRQIAAIKTDETLWTWGSNAPTAFDQGSLGDNTTVSKSSPVQIVMRSRWESVINTGGRMAALEKVYI